jgi:hypothetical protein
VIDPFSFTASSFQAAYSLAYNHVTSLHGPQFPVPGGFAAWLLGGTARTAPATTTAGCQRTEPDTIDSKEKTTFAAISRRHRRLIIGLAATMLASTMVLTNEVGPAVAVPACKLPAYVPSPPAPITYQLTCLPWENIPGTDLHAGHKPAAGTSGTPG